MYLQNPLVLHIMVVVLDAIVVLFGIIMVVVAVTDVVLFNLSLMITCIAKYVSNLGTLLCSATIDSIRPTRLRHLLHLLRTIRPITPLLFIFYVFLALRVTLTSIPIMLIS